MNNSFSRSWPEQFGKIHTVRGGLVKPPGHINICLRSLGGLRLFGRLTAQAERGDFANNRYGKTKATKFIRNNSFSELRIDHSGKTLTVRGELVEPPDHINICLRSLNGLRLFDRLTAQAERGDFANNQYSKTKAIRFIRNNSFSESQRVHFGKTPTVRGELVEPPGHINICLRSLGGLRLFDRLTAQAERGSFANTNKARRN